MLETNEILEDAMIAKVDLEELIKEFDPDIQEIFYNSYGKNLEAIPTELLCPQDRGEGILNHLLKLRNARAQKVILMRFGVITGTPMTLEEVANELGITKERVRQIESMFFRRAHHRASRKKIIDYLND